MNENVELQEFIDGLHKVNNINGLQRDFIIDRIKELDGLELDKENLPENTFYPYSPYLLTMVKDDEVILSLCVYSDEDVSLDDLSEDVFPELSFIEMTTELSRIDFSYTESCNIER